MSNPNRDANHNDVVLNFSLTRSDIIRPAIILGSLVALFWSIEIVDVIIRWLSNSTLDSWGIRPWQVSGLSGIAFAPFLHGSFAHVAANTVPFIILGALILLRSQREFVIVSVIIALISGFGTWLTGSPRSVHIGASGLIFGYFGYLLLLGYFERSWMSILRALLVGFLYGGIIWGILPTQTGISWQGHLFGFLGGIFAAYMLADRFTASKATADETLEDQIRIRS